MDQQAIQTKIKNEKMKRSYFAYLRGAKGFSESTIEAVEQAIWKYEGFSREADFGKFSDKIAKDFKNWLASQMGGRNGDGLALSTQYQILGHLKDFFIWLCGQPGYKSRIMPTDVQYLRLDKNGAWRQTQSENVEGPLGQRLSPFDPSFPPEELRRRDFAIFGPKNR